MYMYFRALPEKWELLHRLARVGYQAIYNRTGKRYRIGNVASILHRAPGGSIDYAYGCLKIPYVICMEMPPGGSGFDPPKTQILKILNECWPAIRAMVIHVKKKYSINIDVASEVSSSYNQSLINTNSILNKTACNSKTSISSKRDSKLNRKITITKAKSVKTKNLKQDNIIRENIKENIAATYLISRTQPLKPTLTKKQKQRNRNLKF